ncbi:bifunctional UDP-N-acetylglucosamine diphosphorylase/glucosamine-1-phosphate N-acetyltransferase GlmU [Salinispirillum sp. LH 10-3-1]|uniref:Bifunctional protein GlmU n=1 Tax=Salinispirillum sp. LH 10-3-1 TaxID=2952525 RepID=A0AB38YGN1_9GAMM
MSVHIVILAAGQGTRMKSKLPKVLHPLAGTPLVQHVVDTAQQLGGDITLVVGHGAEAVKAQFAEQPVRFVTQAEQLGTGHAVAQALPCIKDDQRVLILYADVPLIEANALLPLLSGERAEGLTLFTASLNDPTGYGRVVREHNAITAIVEQKDATPEQLRIKEINTGIMSVPGQWLQQALPRLDNSNAQQEYYLTDLVAMAVADGLVVNGVEADDLIATQGVNNRVQLAALEREYQRRRVESLMLQGVTVIDPARLDLRGTVTTGTDNVIDVNVILDNVSLGSNVTIGANCIIRHSHIADGAVILDNTLIEESHVGPNANVGPFARLRPGTALAAKAKVGNFVEIKKSQIGEGAKVNHLTYVGDATVGAGANIGAGTITCNYDGVNKYRTRIGDGAFIGSNSTLIAPVSIGDGGYVGAGSVISKDAPAQQLTLARAKQLTLAKWQRPTKKDA